MKHSANKKSRHSLLPACRLFCAVLDEPLNSTARRAKCQACNKESCMRCSGDFHLLPTRRHVEKRCGHWKKHHNVRTCPTCKAGTEKARWMLTYEVFSVRPRVLVVMFNRKYGCCAPLRIITKSAIVSIAAVAAIAGAGIAAIVLPFCSRVPIREELLPASFFKYARSS
ncbi:hypothetical protein PsorP6_017055 [Peronosclerospora sorghi]|uniref:Uncharacterized protein n=1 Tax=Peronosclerospora sorghi TaxID=230839 RepID=A0ACC0WBY7_9STRA|nr:hypothetical protein PsorP6_017055 [Peronosclerospora sorghi]